MAITLYYTIASPPVRAVLFTLKTLNVPHELVHIDLLKREHKSDEFLKVNPQGTVPAIIDDGFALFDSHAINVYLVEKYSKNDKLYPKEIKARSVVNEMLFFDTGVLFRTLRNTSLQIFFKRTLTFVTPDIEATFVEAYKTLERLLNRSQFVAGNDITIADFSVITTLTTLHILVPVKKDKFPLVFNYIERCKSSLPYYSDINEAGVNAFQQYLAGMKFQLSSSL